MTEWLWLFWGFAMYALGFAAGWYRGRLREMKRGRAFP
jgi:hypothetical protein